MGCIVFEVITLRTSRAQHPQPRTQTKKRWGPALWLWKGLVAPAGAKLRKPQRKIRSHKEKQSQQSQHRTHKAANKKAACRKEKKNRYPTPQKKETKSIYPACGALTENATVGRLCIGQPPTGGGRSLDCRYPQNRAFHLVCGFA